MASYFVHFIDDDPVLVYGPYGLAPAKDFARIGSQPGKTGGGRRAVFAGPVPTSRLIRVYEEGERVWPRSVEALGALEPAEIPRVLAPKPKKHSAHAAVAANPPEGWRAVPLHAGPQPARRLAGAKTHKRLQTKLLTAMRLYLGSVDYAPVKTQQRFYNKVLKHVNETAAQRGSDAADVWRSAEEAARTAGIIRPQPGRDY